MNLAFEFVEHTGDTAVRLEANGAVELFREAVRAMLALYLGRVEAPEETERVIVDVALEGEDAEQLLVDLFAELIWRFDVESLLAVEFDVSELETSSVPAKLSGALRGVRFDPTVHEVVTEVKAATYHGLSIEEENGIYRAQVVIDL